MGSSVKILDGRELAGFVKERQAHEVAALRGAGVVPRLVIIRDSDAPVISKYVTLKKQYGADIGVEVKDVMVSGLEALKAAVTAANDDAAVHGIIVQLPLTETDWTAEVLGLIAPEKDVDGLSGKGDFDSATATAINWLLAGHNIELAGKRIAIVGRGRLVGAPLARMWRDSGLDVTVLHHGDDLSVLVDYDVIVSGTGVPELIDSSMVSSGAVVVDAGTASEGGVLVGDVAAAVRERTDLAAITPRVGGVGPLTVGVLFEDVISAAKKA